MSSRGQSMPRPCAFLIVVAGLWWTAVPTSASTFNPESNRTELRIAYMAPRESINGYFSAQSTVGALKLALNFIQRKEYLYGYDVRVKWYDSACRSKTALAAAVDAQQEFKPDLFLGPPCSSAMRGVAQLASHWNVPVFGWVSNDHDFRDKLTYSTLVRLFGPLNQMATTMRYVSSMFQWKRYAMVYDAREPYDAVHEAIVKSEGNTSDEYKITSAHKVSEDMSDAEVRNIFSQIRKYARIIMLAVPWMSMRKYVLIANELNMTTAEFALICINGDVYTGQEMEEVVTSDKVWRRGDDKDEVARVAFESVLHVIMATSEPETFRKLKNLVDKVQHIKSHLWEIPNNAELDAYAPFLYDATMVWAILVNKTLNKGGDPSNGTLMFEMAQGTQTEGVTGVLALDMFSDRLVNNWILDMKEDGNFTAAAKIFNTQNGGMVYSMSDINKMKMNIRIRWPDGTVGIQNVPPDTPRCGFEGEFCRKVEKSDYTDVIIGAAAGSSFVLFVALAVQFWLRRYRRRKQLESMLWQVKFEEIDFFTALMCGSIRNSFRNLVRRRSTNTNGRKLSKTRRDNGVVHPDALNSPRYNHVTETGMTMFGPVGYLRGSLVSVRRMNKTSVNLTKEVLQELNQLIELKHQNVCAFVGACVDPGRILLLWEYCAKGSLQDVIMNNNIKLENLFKYALCQDVAKGLDYIHKSSVSYHGNLKSSNCVVDSRWTCKLTDFGVPRIRAMDRASTTPQNVDAQKVQWTAPELLREEKSVDMQKADIFSLGIIMKEVFTRQSPYGEMHCLRLSEIIEKVKTPIGPDPPFRPLLADEVKNHRELTGLIVDCWHEDPNVRPSAARVNKMLQRLNPAKNMTVIDNMLSMLEKYANHLEEIVAERTSDLDAEKRKTENLLYRMLPQSVAEDLKLGLPVKAEHFDAVTVYFSDIVGFTRICAESTAIEVVNLLNTLYTLFDAVISHYDVYKVETIGDAYMLASGLPKRNGEKHIREIADCSLDLLASVRDFKIPHQEDKQIKIRIGIHSGPVVAGVVGQAMPRYCLFGDTVNTASRMESTGVPLKIHMSSDAHDLLSRFEGYHFAPRGLIDVKGKGQMQTYFLVGRDGFLKELPTERDPPPPTPTPIILNNLRPNVNLNSRHYVSPKVDINVWEDKLTHRVTQPLEVTPF